MNLYLIERIKHNNVMVNFILYEFVPFHKNYSKKGITNELEYFCQG